MKWIDNNDNKFEAHAEIIAENPQGWRVARITFSADISYEVLKLWQERIKIFFNDFEGVATSADYRHFCILFRGWGGRFEHSLKFISSEMEGSWIITDVAADPSKLPTIWNDYLSERNKQPETASGKNDLIQTEPEITFVDVDVEKPHFLDAYTFARTFLKKDVIEKRRKLIPPRPKQVVLVIEDDAFTKTLLTTLLSTHSQVISAASVKEGLNAYTKYLPDMILMDVELPDGRGDDFTRAICEADPKAFVVMLSANSTRDTIVSAQNFGARGFIGKPFRKDRILHFVQQSDGVRYGR